MRLATAGGFGHRSVSGLNEPATATATAARARINLGQEDRHPAVTRITDATAGIFLNPIGEQKHLVWTRQDLQPIQFTENEIDK